MNALMNMKQPMFTEIELELGFVIEPELLPYCGPLFFSRSLTSAFGNVTANGSFGLVDTGQKRLLVTCHHVWDEFQKARDKDSQLRLLVCLGRPFPVVLDLEPFDQDKSLDIAVFDIAPLLQACAGRKFFSLNHNLPPHVHVGDRLFLFGYPGFLRCATAEGVGFGRMCYAVNVSDVSVSRFVADVSQAKAIYVEEQNRGEEDNPHGGISGSPCFLVQDDRPLRLVGFATSEIAFPSPESPRLLRFTHARCLNPDGTINKYPPTSYAN